LDTQTEWIEKNTGRGTGIKFEMEKKKTLWDDNEKDGLAR
jgi:hypothetical protein